MATEPLKTNQIKITIKVEQPGGTSTIHERVVTLADTDGVLRPVEVITRLISAGADFCLGHISWLKRP